MAAPQIHCLVRYTCNANGRCRQKILSASRTEVSTRVNGSPQAGKQVSSTDLVLNVPFDLDEQGSADLHLQSSLGMPRIDADDRQSQLLQLGPQPRCGCACLEPDAHDMRSMRFDERRNCFRVGRNYPFALNLPCLIDDANRCQLPAINVSHKAPLGLQVVACRFNFAELRKIFLRASQIFVCLHSQGHQRRFKRKPRTSASPRFRHIAASHARRPIG
jgi:hypothetical protein